MSRGNERNGYAWPAGRVGNIASDAYGSDEEYKARQAEIALAGLIRRGETKVAVMLGLLPPDALTLEEMDDDTSVGN